MSWADMMTQAEVAKHLRVGVKAVKRYRERKRNPLIAIKVGRGYLFEPADVQRFKEQCRVVREEER